MAGCTVGLLLVGRGSREYAGPSHCAKPCLWAISGVPFVFRVSVFEVRFRAWRGAAREGVWEDAPTPRRDGVSAEYSTVTPTPRAQKGATPAVRPPQRAQASGQGR
eukprot:3540233-Prymnesium_polylepis.1